MKKALMVASVASMIDLFNMNNIRLLQNMGYQVDIACNFENGNITSNERIKEFKVELEDMNINYFHIPIPRSTFRVKDIYKSLKIMKQLSMTNNYELVHCHSPIGSIICREAFKNSSTRTIYTAHGFHFFRGAPFKNWLLFYPIEKYYSKYTDTLITINQEDYQLANSKFNKKTSIVKTNGIGVDTSKFSLQNVECEELDSKLIIHKENTIILSVGQLSRRKNHEVIIEAIYLLNNPKIKYLIIGEGELHSKLDKLIQKLNLESQVYLLGYKGNVNQYLSIADIYAFPSLQEGLPASLMEAMAVGLPCVVSNIRGNNDLIVNGKGGYLVDTNSPREYAQYLDRLMSSKVLQKSMSQYNIERVKLFDVETVNQQMNRIYNITDN